LDFFLELYKSLDVEENQNKVESDNNLCLITNQLLIDKFVELSCGHKFNYIPLYNDIYNHKKKFNNMESSAGSLKTDEIRCPYCRNKQNGLLPYYENMGIEKTHGVNYIDPDHKNTSK
jgi:DNA-directed RNA polymerase subunit RPC12/RpoP